MITSQMVLNGINKGVVKLIDSPYGNEPACRIGGRWFYYAGESNISSAEYVSKTPKAEIAERIAGALEGIRDELGRPGDYCYCEDILAQAGIRDPARDAGLKTGNQQT